MNFKNLSLQSHRLRILLIILTISPIIYLTYRVVENYFYLQKHYFNTNRKDTRSKNLSQSFIVQNTSTLQIDTLDLSRSNLLLNFSATWCKPCLEEVPVIAGLYNNQDRHYYKLYCIFDEETAVVSRFREKHKLNFPLYRLISGMLNQKNYDIYPTTIVCKNGKTDLKIEGKLSETDTTIIYKRFVE